MKIKKGQHGYIQKKKLRQAAITAILFALPLGLFVIGLITTETRLNLFTVVAVVGCLPACKSLVSTIMIFMRKPVSDEVYRQIHNKFEKITHIYDLTFTAYEKTTPVDCIAICGNTAVGYTSEAKADTAFLEKHLQDILKQNSYKVKVKIFKDLKPFLERIGQLESKCEELEKDIPFTPDERYPELSRSELIKHIILAVSL